MNNILVANQLYKTYKRVGEKECKAIDNISVKVEQGDYISIVGKSGAGKTTLLHVLAGIVEADSGDICFENRPTRALNNREYAKILREDIGIVFQDSRLIEEFTVFDNIALPGYICRESADVKKSVYSLLERFGILDLELSHPSELSSGQKQRVAMARALVNNPKVLFLDEPTGNLDIESGKSIYAFLQDINRQGKTIVMVTHDIYAAALSKKVWVISQGKIVAETDCVGKSTKDKMAMIYKLMY